MSSKEVQQKRGWSSELNDPQIREIDDRARVLSISIGSSCEFFCTSDWDFKSVQLFHMKSLSMPDVSFQPGSSVLSFGVELKHEFSLPSVFPTS